VSVTSLPQLLDAAAVVGPINLLKVDVRAATGEERGLVVEFCRGRAPVGPSGNFLQPTTVLLASTSGVHCQPQYASRAVTAVLECDGLLHVPLPLAVSNRVSVCDTPPPQFVSWSQQMLVWMPQTTQSCLIPTPPPAYLVHTPAHTCDCPHRWRVRSWRC